MTGNLPAAISTRTTETTGAAEKEGSCVTSGTGKVKPTEVSIPVPEDESLLPVDHTPKRMTPPGPTNKRVDLAKPETMNNP